MAQNKPWIVVYMKGKTCRAVKALMCTIDSCTDAAFANCKIGAIVDLDKAGLDMMKSIDGTKCVPVPRSREGVQGRFSLVDWCPS